MVTHIKAPIVLCSSARNTHTQQKAAALYEREADPTTRYGVVSTLSVHTRFDPPYCRVLYGSECFNCRVIKRFAVALACCIALWNELSGGRCAGRSRPGAIPVNHHGRRNNPGRETERPRTDEFHPVLAAVAAVAVRHPLPPPPLSTHELCRPVDHHYCATHTELQHWKR